MRCNMRRTTPRGNLSSLSRLWGPFVPQFLPRDVLRCRKLSVHLSNRPCTSHSGIVSKGLNISSKFIHRLVIPSFKFFCRPCWTAFENSDKLTQRGLQRPYKYRWKILIIQVGHRSFEILLFRSTHDACYQHLVRVVLTPPPGIRLRLRRMFVVFILLGTLWTVYQIHCVAILFSEPHFPRLLLSQLGR